uniref:Endonuclease/exonuclease/phosphatase domain-containing protein n=1 Tax=Sus scrofa TaxID=9823 RepID=A0A8D0Z500_PIG
MFHANGWDRKARVAILISNKIDFKMKAIKKDKGGHYLMVKGSIQEEDITIVNIHAPNTGASRYLQQILTDIKREIDGDTIIVGDFNTPLTSMDRSSRQKIRQQRP